MIALYCRVSTLEQAKEGHSIQEQEERLRKYAESQGWEDIEVYTDPGFSGASLDRPAMKRLISDVKNGKIGKVVVYKMDRLSRRQKDTLYLIEDVFSPNGCDFESLSERFDTGTPFGNAMIGILAVFAQLERETIKERMSLGREGRAREGLWKGGSTDPVGYDYIDGQLIINEEEAMQIREVFNLYLQGYGFGRIVKILGSKGYAHKFGEWSQTRVKAVLTNPLYVGKMTFNGEIFDGQHEPIVSDEVFEKAQKIFESKTYKRNKPDTKSLLGGFIFCKQCGARYFRWKDQRNVYRYSCYTRKNTIRSMKTANSCDNIHWRADVLEGIVLDQIRELSLDPNKIKEASSDPHHEKKVESLEKMLKDIEKQRERLLDLYTTGMFSKEELSERVESLNEKSSLLEKEIENEKAMNKTLKPSEVKKHSKLIEELTSEGDSEKLHDLLRILIDYIELDGEDVFIHWNF